MSGIEGIGGLGDFNKEFQNLPPAHHNKNLGSGVSSQGQQAYLDLSQCAWTLFGPGINWQKTPPFIDTTLLNDPKTAFSQMFSNFKQEGVNQINLSFAQICDINRLCKDSGATSQTLPNSTGDYSSNDMALGQTMRSEDRATGKYSGPAYKVEDGSGKEVASNFLQYFSQFAHQNGMKVSLSFGGALGNATDNTFPDSAKDTANHLAAAMKSLGIDSADFDIENSSLFDSNKPEDLQTFFTTLHSDLKSEGKTTTATLMGGSVTDPKFAPILDQFNSKFDDANLMLYSNTQYWLDPSYINTLKTKLNVDGPHLHIGFYSSINYASESSCASGQKPPCPIDSSKSSGANAANFYKALQKDIPGLGEPFVWNDDPTSNKSYNFMQDFYNGIEGKSRTPWG